MQLPSIEQLNQNNYSNFSMNVERIFEKVPILVNKLANSRPFKSYTQLLKTAFDIIAEFSFQEKAEVLNCHPRIGEKFENLSEESKEEQFQKGQQISEEIKTKWDRFNKDYEDKFGFRFVIFVNGRTLDSLLPMIEERMANSKEIELKKGIDEYKNISISRFNKFKND